MKKNKSMEKTEASTQVRPYHERQADGTSPKSLDAISSFLFCCGRKKQHFQFQIAFMHVAFLSTLDAKLCLLFSIFGFRSQGQILPIS